MVEIFEALFKTVFNEGSGASLTFFFGGILFTLYFLERYLKFFSKLDIFNDNFRRLLNIIERYEKNEERRRLRKQIKEGDLDSDKFT